MISKVPAQSGDNDSNNTGFIDIWDDSSDSAVVKQKREAIMQHIESFGQSLTRTRKVDVDYRKTSGIEKVWVGDGEFCDSTDDANRSEAYHKPTTYDGTLTVTKGSKGGGGSNLFINITQMYVDGAAARITDMLTPTANDRPFSFKPTPQATTLSGVKDQEKLDREKALKEVLKDLAPPPVTSSAPTTTNASPQLPQIPSMPTMPSADAPGAPDGGGIMAQAQPPAPQPQSGGQGGQDLGAMMSAMMGGAAGAQPAAAKIPLDDDGYPMTPDEILQRDIQSDAEAKAKKAEDKIWDWMVEGRFQSEVRKVIHDMCKIGTGILKGPVPTKVISRQSKVDEATGDISLVFVEEIIPVTTRISAWNFYPDASCGDDVHNGAHTWERDYITAKKLEAMKGGLGYLDDQIDKVLSEGPLKKYVEDKQLVRQENDRYEIWYYHGRADAEDIKAAGCECEEGESIPVVVTMVNDHVIKVAISVLDSGSFPYHLFVYQAVDHSPWGKGIARIVRDPQRMLNAAVRRLLDNAGLASGPQIIINSKAVTPSDGIWELKPMKLWFVDNEMDAGNVAHAFTSIAIPSMQVELTNMINQSMEFAERVSSMPLIMQGEQGDSTDTVGGMTILKNNASTVLRRIARMFDDRSVPLYISMYEWLMMYGDDDDCKGDFQVHALGSSVLYERDAANQFINQIGQAVLNPAYGLSPEKWAKEFLRGNKVPVESLALSVEEKEKIANSKPPEDPKIAADQAIAKMRIDAEMAIEKMRIDSEGQVLQAKQAAQERELQLKQESLIAELQMKAEENSLQRMHEEKMLQMKLDMETMQFAENTNLTIEQVKAKLATDAMKLKTQKDLSLAGMELDAYKHRPSQIVTPPTEPTPRAADGRAFQG